MMPVLGTGDQGANAAVCCAAERAGTNSRLASTLRDCMARGASHSSHQPSDPVPAQGVSSPDGVHHPVVIMACVESAEDVPHGLRRCFTHELQLEAPDANARKHLLQVD